MIAISNRDTCQLELIKSSKLKGENLWHPNWPQFFINILDDNYLHMHKIVFEHVSHQQNTQISARWWWCKYIWFRMRVYVYADSLFLFIASCVCVWACACTWGWKWEVVCSKNSEKEDTEEAKHKLLFEVLSRLMLLWAGYLSSMDTL